MQRKNKKIAIITTIIMVFMFVVGSITVKAERSWDDGVTEGENLKWESEIDRWDAIISEWDSKREQLHEQYFSDKYEDDAKYCNESGVCFEEDMFGLIQVTNGVKHDFEKSRCDTKNSFDDGLSWECSNSGQVIVFGDSQGAQWESTNSGQVLVLKDREGNKWESSNTGQVITFTGVNGEKWESTNNGQVVEHTDSSGKTWSGSDDDADDMRWKNN